jgi:Flp pilus assembly pilin Flp
MRKLMLKLWNDDAGIVALEYLLVATIVGLGLVVGLAALEKALNAELTELGNAIGALSQGYSVAGEQSFTNNNPRVASFLIAQKNGWNAIDVKASLNGNAVFQAAATNINVIP